MERLLIATGNAHKLAEIRAMLALPGVDVVGLDAVGPVPDVIEDADTFEGNAIKKAAETAAATGEWTLADDSGLAVRALDWAPGVHSARYAGTHGDDAANNAKLLAALAGCDDRMAKFVCAMALASPDGDVVVLRGECPGTIIDAPRGDHGFGYDPLFVPDGHSRTFAEMSDHEKNRLSHRSRALQAAHAAWFAQHDEASG
jgi:XTP/dITP diphosphohydrolase